MPGVERMRPLLGTLVVIRANETPSLSAAKMLAAVDSAFRAIDRVEQIMSFHRANSDVGRLNSMRPGSVVPVHRWTYAVLRESLELWRASDGAFDCNIGSPLMRAGLLPRSRRAVCGARPLGEALTLMQSGGVRLNHPVSLDLGGIAKGFAVDQAVHVLRGKGVQAGLVNAGGDLRVFGDEPCPIWVRCPGAPGEQRLIGHIRDGAAATSANYFTQCASADAVASAIVDPAQGRRVPLTGSVTVIAKTCMQADALTKIVALRKRLPARLQRKARASVLALWL